MTSPKYLCPVCGKPDLPDLPYDQHNYPSYEICDCCGFEFGVTDDDKGYSFESYRDQWFRIGCPYFGSNPPEVWNSDKAKEQLSNLR